MLSFLCDNEYLAFSLNNNTIRSEKGCYLIVMPPALDLIHKESVLMLEASSWEDEVQATVTNGH